MISSNADLMQKWESESNRMYAGYFQYWVYEGKDYYVDVSKAEHMRAMGAKTRPIYINDYFGEE